MQSSLSSSPLTGVASIYNRLGQSSSEGNFGAGSGARGANPLLHFKAFITKFNTDLERQILTKGNGETSGGVHCSQ